MAGVGISLRRLSDRGGLLGPLGAFGYAAILAAGPYLSSSLAIVALGATASADVARTGLALVSYATAFSMVCFAPFQFAAARVLGDLLHEGRADAFGAVLVQLLGPLLALLALSGLGFLAFLPCDLATRAAVFALYMSLGGTWLAMVPLSAAKGYRPIAAIFMAGVLTGALLALALGDRFGLPGLVGGLAVGQGCVFVALLARVDREFGSPTEPLADLGARLERQTALVVAGTAYGLGLWIDRAIFWFHPAAPGISIAGPLRVCPIYDNGMSLAALTTIPALALFLVLAETDLALKLRAYFATLEARAALPTVERARVALTTTAFRNLGLLALLQGTIALGAAVFAPELLGAIKLPWLSVFVFRIGVVGACFQVLFMATLVHLLYLDLTRQAAGLCLLFLVSNGAFTLFAMGGGLPAYGFGFAAATALSLAVALPILEGALSDLNAVVFMRQPL